MVTVTDTAVRMPSEPPPRGLRRLTLSPGDRAFGAIPVVAIAVGVVLLGLLLAVLERDEREQQRLTLINDALWVEQALRFAVLSDQDDLMRLASDIRQGLDVASARARLEYLVRNHPEVKGAAWYDNDSRVVVAVPASVGARGGAIGTGDDVTRTLALRSGQPSYSPAYRPSASGAGFDFVIPLYDRMQPVGFLLARFSLVDLLDRYVPWWVAQKYQVTFIDSASSVLASKLRVTPAEDAPSHVLPFDPPGKGLSLAVTRYDARTQLAHHAIVAAILALSLLAIASLWAMRRHMARRLRAEQALRSEHAFRKAMEDSLTVGMRARDLEGRIIYVNQAFCRMVGWTAGELIGRTPPMPYWLPEDLERTLELHKAVLEGRAPSEGIEIRLQRRSGERFDALIYEAPLIDADGRHCGWMGSVVDVTDRKRMEEIGRRQNEKLAQTARLVTMGEMASTLAHELNQPLAAISSYATGSINRLQAGDVGRAELVDVLQKLGAQAVRAGQIIQHIRDFVRKSEPKKAALQLGDFVRDTADFVLPELRKHGVRFKASIPADLPAISGDRVLLQQVLLNLIRNGVEAMASVPKSRRLLDLSVERRGDDLVLAVADRGPGIAAEIADRLFVPFATTKPEGMGMGLKICRNIVELHKGHLWHEPRAGGGAVFGFTLPVDAP